jgi:hypothetical protein
MATVQWHSRTAGRRLDRGSITATRSVARPIATHGLRRTGHHGRAIDLRTSSASPVYGRLTSGSAPHEHCFADPTVTAIVIVPLASNARAIAFYHRLGYVTVERRICGDDDCLVLTLTRDAWREMAARSEH